MPELIEVEAYRRVAMATVGREIVAVDAPDLWYLKGVSAEDLAAALRGTQVVAVRRRGKLLLLDCAAGAVLGLRFGMTGRLLVDGADPVGALRYSSARTDAAWERFSLRFADGGRLVVHDPRRLGGVELDPAEDRLGPDAATLTRRELAGALAGSEAPLKARLLDQGRVAGLGNLLVDEILWRARLSPLQPAADVTGRALDRLHRSVLDTVAELSHRGGSHTGDLQEARDPRSDCPRCGTRLARATVGGRTTVWCPVEQRASATLSAGRGRSRARAARVPQR